MRKTFVCITLVLLTVCLFVGCSSSPKDEEELITKGKAAVLHSAGRTNDECEWVQLWANGPKWATMNVGATAENYNGATEDKSIHLGGLFNFGISTDRRSVRNKQSEKSLSTSDIQGTSEDTAKTLWGDNWQMPTKEDFCNLGNVQSDGLSPLENVLTKWEWCDGQIKQYVDGCTLPGFKVSGVQDGYTDNSIFLPMCGFYKDDDTYGDDNSFLCIWSSTGSTGSKGYIFGASQSANVVDPGDKIYGYCVRAILK